MIPKFTIADGSIPALGLGTWKLTGSEAKNALESALRMGYRHIDTAAYYGNHEDLAPILKTVPREELFLTTKVWRDNLSKEDFIAAVMDFLQQLDVEYLDLVLVHWPNKEIPVEETCAAFAELKKQGKIRHAGVSNFTIKHLEEIQKASTVPIVTNQVEFHPFLYQKELLEYCTKHGIRLTAYSPLARGKVIENESIKKIAESHNKTPAQIALRWLHEKDIIVIPKGSSEEHLRENMEIFDFKLTADETDILDKLPQERLIEPSFAEF